jgi:indole-3-glycerol phosphate synthase
VNNRNLDTLEVDTGTAPRLLPRASGLGRVLVAESGISDVKQARLSREAGAHAVLVGNALMRDPLLITSLLEVGR